MVTDGLAAPGPAVTTSLFAEERLVEPGEGLVRVRLTPSVLARTRDGLPDIRFVTGDSRSVPYVLSTNGSERLAGVTWSQEEHGSMTRLRIDLPENDIPIERLVLRTERHRFERTVIVKANSKIVGQSKWIGNGEGVSRLVLEIDQRVPQTLWIELDNRDSLPLPFLEPEISVAVSEAWLVAPDTEMTMVYGSNRALRPGYDLALVRGEILDSPATPIALGGPVVLPAAPAPAIVAVVDEGDRGPWLVVAIAFLSLGLGGLALRLASEADDGYPESEDI
jgi:hypothetical protein